MVRLRKDKKNLILNEKRRKLYFQKDATGFAVPEITKIDQVAQNQATMMQQSHYKMYPDFETNPNLMMSLVIEIAPMANQQTLVSFIEP